MSLSPFLVPLLNTPQTFNIALNGVEYTITCRYNASDLGGWFIDIDDTVSGNNLVHNIPLVAGADLLAQYEYLNFYGALVVFTQGQGAVPPTLDDLGINSNLYFVVNNGN